MPSSSASRVVLSAFAVLMIAVAPADADKCTAAKLKAIGKKESGLLVCHDKAAVKGDATLLAPCFAKVEAKYSAAFSKAGVCGGDQLACGCLAEKCTMAVRIALPEPGPSKCESARLKAAGKRATAKLMCNAKAAAAGVPVDAACLQKADAKYQTAFAKTTGCSGDPTNVATIVDRRCVSAVGADATGGGTVGAICSAPCSACGAFLTKWGSAGTGDGEFDHPFAIGIDGAGDVYVADFNNQRVQKFTNDGTFVTKWGSPGTGDGQFNHPIGLALDPNGNVFVSDVDNNRIQKFTGDGTFITKWGSLGSADGQFTNPLGVAVDPSGNVFTVEETPPRVQQFTNEGVFITKWGSFGTGDGQFLSPPSVAADANGNVFVPDDSSQRVEKFTNNGTFLSKWGTLGIADGQFNGAVVVAVDRRDNTIYVDELNNRRIQKFTNDGAFLTKWGSAGSGDGQFTRPQGIGVDGNGNVFVSDGAEPSEVAPINNRIQKFACP